MGYYIYDQDGYVDEIGNSATIEALSKVLSHQGPAFNELFTKGMTEKIDDLLDGIDKLDTRLIDPPTRVSIKKLEEILEHTVGIAIITDGCGFMPPEMTEEDYT
jgi:hypothetical protein